MAYRLKLQKKDMYEEMEFIFDFIDDAIPFMKYVFYHASDKLVVAIEEEASEECADTAEE